jgi:hypothetical protein
MNSDAIKNILGQVATVVLSILVATGVISGDDSKSAAGALTTLVTSGSAAIPAVLLLVNLAASIYRYYGMKKVPDSSVALQMPASAPQTPPVGSHIDLGPLKGTAKVVG